MSEEQDKQVELAKLQAQYARIIADPTRSKEALEIQKKIKDLQEDIAWTAAEKQVEAQQKDIDKQVEDLEDYQSRMDEYYEKLLEDNNNFSGEANTILEQDDESILNWIAQNDEEFQHMTDEQRRAERQSLQDTLDTMRKKIDTHWEEVEQIISQGTDSILAFLTQNTTSYLEASSYEQANL